MKRAAGILALVALCAAAAEPPSPPSPQALSNDLVVARRALGDGCLNIDDIIRALYLIGYDDGHHFATPEPLGPGGDPYPAQHAITDPAILDELVRKSVTYFRAREEAVLSGEA